MPWGRREPLPAVTLPLLGLLLVLLVLAAWPRPALAYTVEKHDDEVTGQIVITPTKVEMNLDPGDSGTAEVTVINRTGDTVTFQFTIEDFEGSRDPSKATVFMGDEPSPWGASGWLVPELDSIVLEQGEAVTFDVRVDVPPDAEPGGHYAVLFASRTLNRYEQEAGVKITNRVGTLFLITVSGDIIEDGYLSPLEVPFFSQYGPINMGLVFNNEGNVHLKPGGKVIIRNIFGHTVAEIPVHEWVVLPESSRRNTVEWNGRRLFGRYTASAELTYGSDEIPVFAQASFWVIPWKIIVAILVAVFCITAIAWLLHRRSVRRKEEKAELEKELERLQQGKAAAAPPAEETAAALATTGEGGKLVPLNELFPSMPDTQVVNIDDPETVKLIRRMIDGELDLARSYLNQGMKEKARKELLEARSAAWRIGLLAEVGTIDDLLGKL